MIKLVIKYTIDLPMWQNGDMMKKALMIILAALLVLLPSIAALVIYIMPEGAVPSPVNVSGVLYDAHDSYRFDKNTNSFLSYFFSSAEKRSTKVDAALGKDDYDLTFYAEITRKNSSEDLILYMSLNGTCYLQKEDGSIWMIEPELAEEFLNSEYAISIYEALHTPNLITFSNEIILPSDTDLQYTSKSGLAIHGKGNNKTQELLTYYSSEIADISFSQMPDICRLKVSIGDSIIFDGDLYAFDFSSIPQNTRVKYDIDATWIKSNITNCFGTASYSFYLEYSPAPSLSIEKTSIEAGEFLVLTASDIVDGKRVEIEFSGQSGIEARFFKNGDRYYALIPVSMDLKTGEYDLKVTCGETELKRTISITERNRSTSSTLYSLKAPLSENAFDDMRGLISSIGLNCSEQIFNGGRFINYETEYENDFYLKLGFGRKRSFEEGFDFDMIGIEFTASEGMEIPVINDGVVCASGEDAILGKFVVVDHGFGLKSWYCNISEAILSVGDEVKKGDAIAKTGNSAFYSQMGFYLMTTVLDTPVSPYAIYEENFILPR